MTAVRTQIVLVIALISFYLFSKVPGTFLDLNESLITFISGGSSQVVSEARKPRAGEYVLPGNVQVMIRLLKEAKADSFRFSPQVSSNGQTLQRLVEGAYPLRVSENSHYLLRWQSESPASGCTVLATQGGIALDRCP